MPGDFEAIIEDPLHEEIRLRRGKFYSRAVSAGAAFRILNAVVQLVAVGMTVRYLGADRYGMWGQLTTICFWIGISSSGLGLGLTQRLSALRGGELTEEANTSASSILAILILLSAVLMLATLIFGWQIPWPSIFNVQTDLAKSEAPYAALTAILVASFLLSATLSSAILQGLQRIDIINFWGIGTALLGLPLLLLGIWLNANMATLVFILLLPQIVSALGGWYSLARLKKLHISLKLAQTSVALRMLALGLKFQLGLLFELVIYNTGSIIIAQLFTSEEVVPYTVTLKIILLVNTLTSTVLGPLLPAYGEALSRGDTFWVRQKFKRSVLFVSLLWAAACVPMLIFGGWIINIFAGPAAIPSHLLLWCLLGALLPQGFQLACSILLSAANLLRYQLCAGAIIAVLHIPFAIYLCKRFGPAGVAMSQGALTAFVMLPAMAIGIKKVLK